MISIVLDWKEFSVKLDKMGAYLKSNLSNNYDGLIADTDKLQVVFKDEVSQEDTDAITNYWSSLNSHSFDISQAEIIQYKLTESIRFGSSLLLNAMVQNIQLGLAASGKAKLVSDYSINLQYYLSSGSLYAALEEFNDLIASEVPLELAPFITLEKLTANRDKLQLFLQSL